MRTNDGIQRRNENFQKNICGCQLNKKSIICWTNVDKQWTIPRRKENIHKINITIIYLIQ